MNARWIKLALPIAGLSAIPVIGLGYVAVATIGPTKTSAAEADSDSDAPKAGSASKRSGSKSARSTGRKPRDDAARLCCEKLVDLAQSAEIEKRSTYLNASKACDAAESDEEAVKQVASIIGGDRLEVPPECAKD